MDAADDPVLNAIAEEAHRLTAGRCALRVHGHDAEACVVIEMPPDAIVQARLLAKRLRAFCDGQGLPRRFAVASGTSARFVSKPVIPEGWPPADAD